METQQRQQIKKYLDLLVRRWKLISLCLLTSMALGLGYYLRMPKVFQASVLLSYEQQRINPARMAPEAQRRLRDTVSTLEQIVTSRNSLEKLIEQFDLYPRARAMLPIEDVIDMMRRDIRVQLSSRGDTFKAFYRSTSQDKVQKVANAIASRFIEENLKYREERAAETSKYTKDELNLAKERLDRKEAAMRDYKLKYYNEMPEQREANMARLTALHEQYQNVQNSIQDLERTKVLIQEQIVARKQLLKALTVPTPAEASTGSAAATPVPDSADPYQRLARLQNYLDSLLGRYTEQHPEVRRTRKLIAKLEAELGAQEDGRGKPAGDELTPKPASRRSNMEHLDPELQQLRIQLKEIDLNIAKLRQDQVQIKKEIEKYEKWIAAAPIREAEWAALTRDYNELRRHYDYLVSQNLEAESVEHLERKQKGSKFKIVDPARYPEKPFQPDFRKIMLMAVGLGLMLGGGYTVAADFIDTSFKDVMDLEQYLNFPVSASIPWIETPRERRRRIVANVCWGVFLGCYFVAVAAAFFYFYRQGQIII